MTDARARHDAIHPFDHAQPRAQNRYECELLARDAMAERPLERRFHRHDLQRQITRRLVRHEHRDLVDELLEDLGRRFPIAQDAQLVLIERVRDDVQRRVRGGGVHGAQTTNFAAMTEYRPPRRANWLQIGSLLGLLMFGSWVMSLIGVLFWERRDMARPAAAIVVLGAAQYDATPSPVLRARLDHAIDLFRRGLAPRIIFTGGGGGRGAAGGAAGARRGAGARGGP